MLDRTNFASWQQRIRLYCWGNENGVNILKSIDEGPFQMGTFRETLAERNEGAPHLGPERARVYFDLSPKDKERYNADIRATNILLQGLPKDIYTLINHYTDTKDIWDNVKMLLEGSELTKEDRESQLYDDFEHFRLEESNYDKLYAYLKQHEAHANQNKMMLEWFTQHTVDPLALMSNVLPLQYSSQSSTTPPSTHVPLVTYLPHFADNTQLNSGLSPIDHLIMNLTNILALLTQSYKTYLPQTNNQLRTSSNIRNQDTVQDGRVVFHNVKGQQNRGLGNNARGIGVLVMRELRTELGMQIQGKQGRLSVTTAMENGVVLDEEKLLFITEDDRDAFDSDVDEALTAQTLFMANLSSADPVYDKAGPSYDSDILSEVHDHDNYQDAVCEHHEVHEMHDDVQPNRVVDSDAKYTCDSNMIPYDQYVKDNVVPVVQSNVSSVPNDAYMMIMHEHTAQSFSANEQNKVVNASLTAELATYKEQVKLYEIWAKFELTKREQKIEEQLRIVITDRNIKEENLKKELHIVKMQLISTINHNKLMVEEVTSLKKDFKQKENKYLEELLDMKALKEKVKDKLFKQDQSLQIVHMLCKPKPYYDEQRKVAIGYKNPLCLTRAKQVQLALYNGHEIIKTHHVPAITEQNINIRLPDYSKENYLETFTPQTQQTPEQIFWSKDLLKMKAKALKEQTTSSRPIKALTVYPLNTPAMLVPRRITPTGVTEGETGFEQTKECYLTEVIPFFKTPKKHFEGIKKALAKEIKEIKEIFEELEAEVDQNVVNRKSVLYCKNSKLTVSRFTEMHDAHTVVQARCLELEAELSKLKDKIQKDDHNELVKHFSNLEVNHLNLQLKYQHLKESLGNNTSLPARDAPDFDSVFVIEKIKASIQGKDNAIKKLRMQISQLKETRSEADRTLDFRALDFQITQLTEKITVLQEQNELFRAENAKIKQHYKELYDSINITRANYLE
ncbi:hypothetical protein Tco_0559538 [Tanacetum coccineum]